MFYQVVIPARGVKNPERTELCKGHFPPPTTLVFFCTDTTDTCKRFFISAVRVAFAGDLTGAVLNSFQLSEQALCPPAAWAEVGALSSWHNQRWPALSPSKVKGGLETQGVALLNSVSDSKDPAWQTWLFFSGAISPEQHFFHLFYFLFIFCSDQANIVLKVLINIIWLGKPVWKEHLSTSCEHVGLAKLTQRSPAQMCFHTLNVCFLFFFFPWLWHPDLSSSR